MGFNPAAKRMRDGQAAPQQIVVIAPRLGMRSARPKTQRMSSPSGACCGPLSNRALPGSRGRIGSGNHRPVGRRGRLAAGRGRLIMAITTVTCMCET